MDWSRAKYGREITHGWHLAAMSPLSSRRRRCVLGRHVLHVLLFNRYRGICGPRAQRMRHMDRPIEWRHCDIAPVHDRVRSSCTDNLTTPSRRLRNCHMSAPYGDAISSTAC